MSGSRGIATADNVLNAAIATSTLAKELSNSFPPARLAVSILLLIFQTIQTIRTNQAECYRLASRCLDLLTDIADHMKRKWDTAPPSLVKNLEKFGSILQAIYQRLIEETDNKWHSRMFRKAAITDALAEFNAEVDDAARSFQLLSLVNIHYAVERRPQTEESDNTGAENPLDSDSPEMNNVQLNAALAPANRDEQYLIPDEHSEDSPVQPDATPAGSGCSAESTWTTPDTEESSSVYYDSPASSVPSSRCSSPDRDIEDHCGLPAQSELLVLHQSDVLLKGRSRIKSGWWAETVDIQVRGRQNAIMKRYEGPIEAARERWSRDLALLRAVRHPSLPRLLGYSAPDAATPFLVLGDVSTIALNVHLKNMIYDSSIAICVQTVLQFYRDIMNVASYLRKELQLPYSRLQDYVETVNYRVNPSGMIVIGIPSLETEHTVTIRSWSLSQSARDVLLKALPQNWEDQEEEHKCGEIVSLIRTLLSSPLSEPDQDGSHIPDYILPLLETTAEDAFEQIKARTTKQRN